MGARFKHNFLLLPYPEETQNLVGVSVDVSLLLSLTKGLSTLEALLNLSRK